MKQPLTTGISYMISGVRAGQYSRDATGVRAFVPRPLPPSPALEMRPDLVRALSKADQALARLDGATYILPNPELFVYGFMRQEAVLSSQIEGTQASLDDLLAFESDSADPPRGDVVDVVNYLDAMNWGIAELKKLPVSLRLIKGLHHRLLAQGRGSNKTPGEFRSIQNWIGSEGATIEHAQFVPPTVEQMHRSLADLERFIHEDQHHPTLVRNALVHAQFETIHPFVDGNGRLGRMIITFLLCSDGVLRQPILYLSLYFKQNRERYYALLQSIRDTGDWESWVLFFLEGVRATAESAFANAQRIIDLQKRLEHYVQTQLRSKGANALAFAVFQLPYMTITQAARAAGVSYPQASKLVDNLVEARFLKPFNQRQRDRIFSFDPYLEILRTIDLRDPGSP